MGGNNSSLSQWQPPEIDLSSYAGSSVDYHMVATRVNLNYQAECCVPVLTTTVDCDTLYALLGEQYAKGYHLLHFTRSPGDYRLMRMANAAQVIMLAFFRKNTEVGARGRYGDSTTWKLHVEKSWLQTYIQYQVLSPFQNRVVHTNQLVESITRNTQNGERLISATVTGQCEPQSARERSSSMSPYFGVDLLFEIPTPVPPERYVYNIALVPVTAEFRHPSFMFFPDIDCDWTATLNRFLSEGWRLIDIYIDVPMIEQLHTPQKQKRRLCPPLRTDALWILEKPASRMSDPTPMYEGTIVEHPVMVGSASHGYGCQSHPAWDQVVRDMGSRGWELACTLECRDCTAPSWTTIELKSLLFFQRPLQ